MDIHGYPLSNLEISLQKLNAQRQEVYHMKAHLFFH